MLGPIEQLVAPYQKKTMSSQRNTTTQKHLGASTHFGVERRLGSMKPKTLGVPPVTLQRSEAQTTEDR